MPQAELAKIMEYYCVQDPNEADTRPSPVYSRWEATPSGDRRYQIWGNHAAEGIYLHISPNGKFSVEDNSPAYSPAS